MKLPEPQFYSKLEDRMRHRKSNEWGACKAALLDWDKYCTGGNRKPVPVANSQGNNVRGSVNFSQSCCSETLPTLPHTPKEMHLGKSQCRCCLLCMVFTHGRLSDWNLKSITQPFRTPERLAVFPYRYVRTGTFQVLSAWLPQKGQAEIDYY